uniref:Uncharacterized protein n=1 Tax=Panagrolaimus davidi TaxID=227884 RepID=A0A914PCL3_9BILA
MMSNFGIFVMLILLPFNYACIPTRNIDETSIIPITTLPPPPPPPCSSCPTPVQIVVDQCRELTITPCDENNRLIYDCGLACLLYTQNEPTDVFIDRGNLPVDVICDNAGNFFIGTPTDQIKAVKCE